MTTSEKNINLNKNEDMTKMFKNRKMGQFKVPSAYRNVGFKNTFQRLLNKVKRLIEKECTIRVVIGWHNDIDRIVYSNPPSITGTCNLHLYNLENTDLIVNITKHYILFVIFVIFQRLTSVISGTSSGRTSSFSIFRVSPGAKLTRPEVGLMSPFASFPFTVARHWIITVPVTPEFRTIGRVTSVKVNTGSSIVSGSARNAVN